MCTVETSPCPLKCNSPKCKLQFQATNGECKSYTSPNKEVHLNKSIQNSTLFKCTDTLNIDNSLVNDLVPDCGRSAQDEFLYKVLCKNFTHFRCPRPHQVPCKPGHSKCYNLSDLYRLGKFNNLVPCRTGSLLESCSAFQCNTNFKCLNFYCISWSYVCNGRWDCPHGSDEQTSYSCGGERTCPGFFRSKESQMCLHTQNVCDCHLQDDEVLCQLKSHHCLLQCSCLLLALLCAHVNVHLPLFHSLPFQSYHLIGIDLQNVDFLA